MIEDYKQFFKAMSKNIKLYLLILFFATLVTAAYNVLFGIYLSHLGYSEDFVGQILSLKTMGIALGAIPVSILAERINKKMTLMLGLFLMLVSSLAILNIKVESVMALFSIFFGIGHATVMVLQAPIIYENTDDEHRVTAFSMAFVMQNVAFVVGSFVLGHLSQAIGDVSTEAYGNFVVLNAATLLVIVGILLSTQLKGLAMTQKNREKSFSQDVLGILKGYRKLLSGRTLSYLFQVGLVGLGAGMIVPFFSLYLKNMLDASDGTVGTIMAISQFGTVIGGLMVPPLAKYFGRVKTVILCQLLSIPFLLAISFPQGIIIVTIAFFFRSSLMNMSNPLIRSVAMEIVDDHTRTYMSGMISLTNNLFRSLGIFFGGYLMYRFNYNTPYYFTIFFYLIGTYIIYRVFYQSEKKIY